MSKSVKFIAILVLALVLVCSCAKKYTAEDVASLYVEESKSLDLAITIVFNQNGTYIYKEYHDATPKSGKWTLEDNIITLTDKGPVQETRINKFRLNGDELIFIKEGSSNFSEKQIIDGTKFSSKLSSK